MCICILESNPLKKVLFVCNIHSKFRTSHQWCRIITLSILVFLLSPDFFQNQFFFFFNYFRDTIRVSNSLNQDEARSFVGSDQSVNCLQKLSADNRRLKLILPYQGV